MTRRSILILFFIFCLPLPALAVLTLGTVLQKDTLIQTERQAVQFASALQTQLHEEVKIRIFPDETTLHAWLNRYQQVDIAAFSRAYVQHQPAGEFFQLHGSSAFGSLAPLVLRQGISQRLQHRLQTAISALAADPAARSIFQKPTVVATAFKPAQAPRKPLTKKRPAAPAPTAPVTAAPVAIKTAPASTASTASPPVPVKEQPPASPPQATTTPNIPRIWLEQDPGTAPPEQAGSTVTLENPAGEFPETAPLKPEENLQSQYSRSNGKPTEATSMHPDSDKSRWVAGIAIAIIPVAGGFLFLRRRRRSSIRTVTRAPRVPLAPAPSFTSSQRDESRAIEQKATLTPLAPEIEKPEDIDATPQATEGSDREDELFHYKQGATALPNIANENTAPTALQDGDNFHDAAAEESWLDDTIELEPLDEVADPLVEAPEKLAATEEEMQEPTPTSKSAGFEASWNVDEFEPIAFEAVESPLTNGFRDASPDSPVDDPTEMSVTGGPEDSATPFAADSAEMVNFEDGEEGSFVPLEEPYLTSVDEETDIPAQTGKMDDFPVGADDSRAMDFSNVAVSDASGIVETDVFGATTGADDNPLEQPPLSLDDSGLGPFSLDREPPMPLAQAPDYRSFFQSDTTAEPNSRATTSLPVKTVYPGTIERPTSSSGQAMSLRMRGELGPSQVPALLKLISGQKKAGTLVVRSNLDEKRIYFRRGKIASAAAINRARQTESGALMNKFGELLVQQGIISEQARDRTLEICARQPFRPIGEVLMETCHLSHTDLKNTLRMLIEEMLFSLILFPKGSFEYITEKSPIPAEQDLAININELLKEAADQAGEWRELRKVIPSLDTVMEYKENSRKKLLNARMTSRQELILSLVDGKRTIQEICDEVGMLELEVYRFLCLMTKARFISPVQKGSFITA